MKGMTAMNDKADLILVFSVCVLLTTVVVRAETANDVTSRVLLHKSTQVRTAIEEKHPLPDMSTNVLRDISQLDLRKAFPVGFELNDSRERGGESGMYVERHMLWWNSTEDRAHKNQGSEIQLTLVRGEKVASNALEQMFVIMEQTSMGISPSTFDVLENGLGTIAFAHPWTCKREGKELRVTYALWFCRDNIAIKLLCSGSTDLLPIAKAIDRLIQACPGK
jgi:hypothetical protein